MLGSILLVGCGKMGSALARGWINDDISNLSIVNPKDIDQDIRDNCDSFYKSVDDIGTSFDTIVLAIKPQILDDVCKSLTNIATENTLILSIAAGKTLSTIEQHFSNTQPITRTMPNLPSSIGKGISVCVSNKNCTSTQKKFVTKLMDSVGKTEWINDEEQMDAVTALSGSGPAYLFHLVEAMASAGISAGLPKELANNLARESIIGSSHLLEVSSHSPSELREQVTSKGGTTQAALDVLMNNNDFEKLIKNAVKSASLRSKELS